jgi:hypothetical protein
VTGFWLLQGRQHWRVSAVRQHLPLDTADDRDAGAARANGHVEARDVNADERLDERRDGGVTRVLDVLAALGRARRRAGAAVVRRRHGHGEGGDECEGEELGEHGGGGRGRGWEC